MKFVKSCSLSVFSRFGIPKTLVSDNGPEFIQLKHWLLSLGCIKLETSTYSPQSNGAAERAVQTIKHTLKGYSLKVGDLKYYLLKILFNHRYLPQKNYCEQTSELQ